MGASSSFTCTGLATGITGVRNNHAQQRGGGVFLAGSSSSTRFDGTFCDMGVTGNLADNKAGNPAVGGRDVDAAGNAYSFGENATIACNASTGC